MQKEGAEGEIVEQKQKRKEEGDECDRRKRRR
jgi:hypothetical protein